jgi:aspartate oxidase
VRLKCLSGAGRSKLKNPKAFSSSSIACVQALEYAAGRSSGRVPQRLGAAAAAWLAEKRARLNTLMWSCAGIVRNQAHLKVCSVFMQHASNCNPLVLWALNQHSSSGAVSQLLLHKSS